MSIPDIEAIAAEGGMATGVPERPTVKHGLSFAAYSFVGAVVLGLASSIVTSRLYGIKVIGQYALVSAPYLITTQISQVNEGTAFVREAAALPARDLRLSALFRLLLAFSMGLTAVVAALVLGVGSLLLRGPVAQSALVAPAAAVMLGYLFLDNVSWNADAVFSAFRAGSVLFWARIAQVVSFIVGALALSFVTDSVWGLVGATLLSFTVPLAYRMFVLGRYIRWRLPAGTVRAHARELPALLRFGLVLVPGSLLGSVTSQAGTWVIGSVESVTMTGAYARALGLAVRFNDAGYRIAEILMPGMVERLKTDDREGACNLLDRALRVTGLALLTLAAAGGGAAAGLMRIFGPGFERGSVLLALLSLAYVLSVFGYLQSQGFVAIGRPGVIVRLSVTYSVIALASMFLLGHWIGAAGIAGAYVAGQLAIVVLGDCLLGRELRGASTFCGPRVLIGLASVWAAGYASSWAIVQVSTSLLMTAVAVAGGLAASVVVALVLRLVPERDLQSVRRRLSGLRPRR
jgi:O-antigen/teichoic acid export membrane protein